MSSDLLQQWLQRLESLHPSEIELGLDRVAAVARRLDLLPPTAPAVIVAGTNGKGSTVAVLEALLVEAGHRTGAYTSPHFLRFNERIRIGAEEVGDEQIVEALAAVDEARGDTSLTYFEFATLAALLLFRAAQVDFLLLEVGLGGRLDAVNIVDPAVAVITSIGLDHQEWLGYTRGEIAVEKAGIARAGKPAVVADPDAPAELGAALDQAGATPLLVVDRDFHLRRDGQGGSWLQLAAAGEEIGPLALPPGLLPENVAAALQAVALLGVKLDGDLVGRALSRARPTARLQTMESAGVQYLLDVAHNPDASNKLHEYISVTPCNGKTIAIFSIMNDKDIKGVVEALAGDFDAWFLADQPDNPRAATASQVADVLREAGEGVISISKNLRQAMARARQLAAAGDRLVVFGSFFTVAAVLPLLERDAGREVAL